MPAPDFSLVALIKSRPPLAAKLAGEHVDDGSGRCRSCSSGAASREVDYPCSIRLAWDEAHRQKKALAPVKRHGDG